MRKTAAVLVSAVGASLMACTASADIILSNLPGNSSGSGTNLGLGTDGADRTKAVGLTMGSDSLEFQSLVAMISNLSTPNSVLSGGIYSSVSNNPGTLLVSFDPVDIPTGTDSQLVTVTTAGTFTLQAGTSYWFVLDGPVFTNSLLWDSLTPNTAPTGFDGVSFVGYRFSSNGGTSWGNSTTYNGVEINAVPAPAALGLLGAAGLVAARRRR